MNLLVLKVHEGFKGSVSLKKIEEDQKQFKLKLNEVTIGNSKTKSEDQLYTIKNIKNLYN